MCVCGARTRTNPQLLRRYLAARQSYGSGNQIRSLRLLSLSAFHLWKVPFHAHYSRPASRKRDDNRDGKAAFHDLIDFSPDFE